LKTSGSSLDSLPNRNVKRGRNVEETHLAPSKGTKRVANEATPDDCLRTGEQPLDTLPQQLTFLPVLDLRKAFNLEGLQA